MDCILYVNVAQNFKEKGFVAIFADAMKRFLNYCITVLLLVAGGAGAQVIQVNDNYTAQQLVDALVSGSCAQVSNISVNGWAGGAGSTSYGYFTANGSGFPFNNGIILSSGFAASAPGPNNSLLSEGSTGWGGDNDLEAALNVNNTINATVLEFDFIPLTDHISFDYIFASEQYLTSINSPNQCNYTDGFAFLLKEAGTTNPYRNLAVVPGTNIPVKVNTVRGTGVCPAANEQYFGGFNPVNSPINFNGQTVILTAQSDVVAGTTYHIKLVVADQGNNLYDSAIFLGGGTFNATSDLGPDRLIANDNALCNGETLVLNADNPAATNYTWYRNNVQQTAANGSNTFNVTTPGVYSVEVELNGSCISKGDIEIEYITAIPSSTQTLLQCDDNNDGIAVFNLRMADALVNNDPSLGVTYYTNSTDANAGGNQGMINNASAYTNTLPNQQVFARVYSQQGCYSVSTVILSTSNNTITNPSPLVECDDDGTEDGFYTFDLTQRGQQILQSLPTGLQLQYFNNYNDALASENAIPNPATYTNTTAFSQVVYARVYNAADCYGIAQIKLTVNTFGAVLQDENLILCAGSILPLDAGNFSSYSWNTTPVQNTRAIIVNQPGTYTVTVTKTNGCEGRKTFTVRGSGPATDAVITVNDFAGNNNSVSITPVGTGNYEYSINGTDYQNDPVFTGVESGQYTVYIRDINGCLPIFTKVIYVLDYPRFFTPNADSYNDYWTIPLLRTRAADAEISIFDRYGKFLYRFKGSQRGWDGTYNGKPLPSTDYWFVLKFNTGITIKGHFSLMR